VIYSSVSVFVPWRVYEVSTRSYLPVRVGQSVWLDFDAGTSESCDAGTT
jgi:hypothetical protein